MYPGTHAKTDPGKPAIILAETGQTISYGELDSASARLARYLHRAGLRRGDHLAMLTDNTITAFEVYWAAVRSGLYITLVNRHLSAGEVAYIVNDCEARVLVVSAALAELAEAVVEHTPGVERRLAFGGAVPGYRRYEDELTGVPDEPLREQPRGIDMLYSSGTTGRPKGIKPDLPEHEVDEQPAQLLSLLTGLYGMDEHTVYLSPAPIYHAAPLRFTAGVQALGGTVIMMREFDAERALAYIERFRVTHSQWVPTMFVRMLKLPEPVRHRYDTSSLRVAVHAAAPCPVEVKRAMIDWWGPVLYEYYSSTEANGMTFIDSHEWLRKPGSVGRDGPLGTVRICGPDGAELPAGEVGTVYFERDELPFRYHRAPDKTASAQHPEHPTWTTTGDIGYLDEERYLFLTDRASFMIISGGVNIYPQEVENCLTVHPKVLDAGVIGVPDREMGESVLAVVELVDGTEPGPDLERELLDYARERIAHYKCPRRIEFSAGLPRTPTGKLVKHKLREQYA